MERRRAPADNAEREVEERRKLRRRVEALIEGAAPKRLTRSKRLMAAAKIGELVRDARRKGRSMSELCAGLGEKMPSKAGRGMHEPFRLHRWMLKGGATEVTDTLREHHKDRAEPLSTTATYFTLIEQLAAITGHDPLESQGALLRALDLQDGRLQGQDDEIQPEQKLAALLHRHAALLARDLDLASLFQRAERVQAGWNIQRGPEALVDLVPQSSAHFSAGKPIDRRWWLEVAAPPVPAVPIARIPFGLLPGPFRLTNDAGETREEPGHAVAYWELYLAIGPSGPLSVAPYLMRGTSVDLMVGGQWFALQDQMDDVHQIVSGWPHPPRITLDGGTWQVSSEAKPIYREHLPGTVDDPPSHDVPNVRIDPVSTASVRTWLMISGDHVPEDGEWSSGVDRLYIGDPPTTGWIRADCIARSLEAALRDGRLDRLFSEWMDRFLPEFDRFERDWIDSATEQDAAFRQRYADSDLIGEPT